MNGQTNKNTRLTPPPWRLTDENRVRRTIRGGNPERSLIIIEEWTSEPDARLFAHSRELLDKAAAVVDACDQNSMWPEIKELAALVEMLKKPMKP